MAQPDNHHRWIADTLAAVRPAPIKGDYRSLGARARAMAVARRLRKRRLAIAAAASIVALVLILPALPNNSGKLALEGDNSAKESVSTPAAPEVRKLAAAEIARLYADLQKSRDKQRQLEQSWNDYRDRATLLAVEQKKAIDQYLESVASSNRTAYAMLSAERAASSRRPVDATRLLAIVKLYPGTVAAEEAGQMLAHGE